MAPKQNAKAVAGRAKKDEVKAGKAAKEQAVKDAQEDAEWSKGAKGKGKSEDKAAKAADAAARKQEAARLLAEEEAAAPKVKKEAPKAGAKKAAPPKAAASIPSFSDGFGGDEEPSSFSASGLDNALDMMNLVSAKSDKASLGAQASKIETHPERRYKAAFEAYKEEQLPIMRKDHPGLRLQQYQEKLFQDFKKSPLNPFNQASLSYDATKEDKVAALKAQKDEVARRLRDDK